MGVSQVRGSGRSSRGEDGIRLCSRVMDGVGVWSACLWGCDGVWWKSHGRDEISRGIVLVSEWTVVQG